MESSARSNSKSQRRRSLEASLTVWITTVAVIAGLVGIGITSWVESRSIGVAVMVLAACILAPLSARRFLRPVYDVLQALSDGVSAMRDSDFSLSLSTDRNDELSDLLKLYNEVSSALREERQSIYQRELLLDSVIQASPLALLLASDRGKIIYSNSAARRWFFSGRRIEGHSLEDLLTELPSELAEAIQAEQEGLIGFDLAGEPEVVHVTHRWFQLNARRHRLILLERLTRELNRKEVETWKKVIRLISHELRNSLGPIASLARSGRKISELPDPARLITVLSTIEERAEHLETFISGYARFAKLPHPRPEGVDWHALTQQLQQTESFRIVGTLPKEPGYFDPGQVELTLVNLLRNAREAGSDPERIEVEIQLAGTEQRITVRDGGTGMTAKVLASALLPFYSTKRSGTGLGLPLCREIAEAHGGSLQVANRSPMGLEVTLCLPWQQSPSVDPTEDPPPS